MARTIALALALSFATTTNAAMFVFTMGDGSYEGYGVADITNLSVDGVDAPDPSLYTVNFSAYGNMSVYYNSSLVFTGVFNIRSGTQNDRLDYYPQLFGYQYDTAGNIVNDIVSGELHVRWDIVTNPVGPYPLIPGGTLIINTFEARPVPEPSTALMFGLGGLGLLTLRRFKR